MKLPLRFLVPAIGFAALVAFFWIGLHRDPAAIPSPLIGKPAPAFSLASLGDPAWKVATEDFRGKPWVLNVWATWCVGCREEHAALLAIARGSAVPIVGLNWRDERSLALGWLRQLGNPYDTVAFDPEGRTAIDWGVYGAPETFLVGADGTITWKHIGPITTEIWQREFEPLIAAAGPAP